MPLFFALAAASSVVDARERRLPNALLALMAVLALACQGIRAFAPGLTAALPWLGASDAALPGPAACVAGAVLLCGALTAAELGLRSLTGRSGIGLGDVKLAGCWALLCGAPLALAGLAAGSAAGALAALARGRRTFALGPWMNVACAVAACLAPGFAGLLWS